MPISCHFGDCKALLAMILSFKQRYSNYRNTFYLCILQCLWLQAGVTCCDKDIKRGGGLYKSQGRGLRSCRLRRQSSLSHQCYTGEVRIKERLTIVPGRGRGHGCGQGRGRGHDRCCQILLTYCFSASFLSTFSCLRLISGLCILCLLCGVACSRNFLNHVGPGFVSFSVL